MLGRALETLWWGVHTNQERKRRDGSVRMEGVPSTRRPLITILDYSGTHLCSAYTGWSLQDVLLHVHYMWHQVLLPVTKPQNGHRKQVKKKLVRKSLWNQKLVSVTKVTGWHHIACCGKAIVTYLGDFCWRQLSIHLIILSWVLKLREEGGRWGGGEKKSLQSYTLTDILTFPW